MAITCIEGITAQSQQHMGGMGPVGEIGRITQRVIAAKEVVADEPALIGAHQEDIVASSHAGDQAMAPGRIPLQRIDREDGTLATAPH